jgi:hypothetical protein
MPTLGPLWRLGLRRINVRTAQIAFEHRRGCAIANRLDEAVAERIRDLARCSD